MQIGRKLKNDDNSYAAAQTGVDRPRSLSIALGCMGMSGMYGATDEAESLATIHAALDAGVNLLDTGDFYGMGQNEMLLGRALRFQREKVVLSVKFGAQRAPNGAWLGFDARPAAVKTALAYSLKRLGVDSIDIYRPSRLDPTVPIEDTIGAIAEMVKAGYVRYIGLSEVGPETIRRAVTVHPIVDLQIEYALVSRSPEAKIFPALTELGIGATTYGALSRGCFRVHKPLRPATSALTCRALPAPTWNETGYSLQNSKRSPRARGLRLCSWPLPGCWPRAALLFRWWARARGRNWPRAWARCK